MAFAGHIFGQDDVAGVEQDLRSVRNLYFSPATERYDVLAAERIMPVLNFSLGQAKKLSARDLDRG